jgi:hypothetical protein
MAIRKIDVERTSRPDRRTESRLWLVDFFMTMACFKVFSRSGESLSNRLGEPR